MNINITPKLKKYVPILLKAQTDNLNEADTSARVCKVLEDVLGYDAFEEISKEIEIREKNADVAIKIDGVVKFLIEVKRASRALRDRDIEQCEKYAAEHNIQWVLLTNGVTWNLYHLTFGEGIEYETAFSVTLTPENATECAEKIGVLHRSSVKSGAHDEFWKHRTALSAKSIGKAIFFEGTIMFIRRQIRHHEGILIDPQDLAEAIHSLFDGKAREQIGTAKIRGKKLHRRAIQIIETCSDASIQSLQSPPLAALPMA
jgi:predicted type IV restriction endonuclease